MVKTMHKICRSLLALTLLITSVFSMTTVKVEAAEINLALNKPVTVSAEYSTMPASNLTDGDVSTRWSTEANAIQWAYVDLGQTQEFSKFQMTWESTSVYAENYNIYVSDDTSNWGTAVVAKTGNTARVSEDILDTPVRGRYVKLEVTKQAGYPSVSCYEFKIIQLASIQDPAENIALNKNAVANGVEDNATSLAAGKAVDGSTDTRWASPVGNAPHWIYVDLGAVKDVNVVKISWWERKATDYEIQISDDASSWQTVKTLTQPSSKEERIVLDQVYRTRYVRVYINAFDIKDPDGTIEWNNISIKEIEIYGGNIAPQDPTENVALNKNAVANGVEDNAASLAAGKAVDGSTDTRWASPVGNAPHWIYVDLGEIKDVNVVKISWWERKATDYEIQISNDASSWQTVKTLTRPSRKEEKIELDQVYRARYVRVYINAFDRKDPDGTIEWNNISIKEIEIYGGNPDTKPSLEEVLDLITIDAPQKGDTKLAVHLPDVEEYGYEVLYNGTDYEQVIGDDLTIYTPIVNKTVKVSFKAIDTTKETNGSDKNYRFREIPVTVIGEFTKENGDNAAPNVLPELSEWKGHTGRFVAGNNAKAVIADDSLKDMADAFAKDYEEITGKALTVVRGTQNEAGNGDFYFSLTADTTKGLQDEGYLMEISSSVRVEAETATGAYWATRTILQSIKQTGDLPCGVTRDYPLYKVRGFILDVGRKTFKMDYLKQIVQQMAWYKMNDLQIHLNDNLIPLENLHPNEMDAYSAFRLESDIKKGGNGGKNQADLTSTDVFYTKDEFRDFIKESRIYGVNIVPEIDTPAHSLALTKVRPDLRLGTDGRQNDHLDLTNQYDACLEFVQSIFSEYMNGSDPVFDEDTIIHVGADEYSADQSKYVQFAKDMISWVKDSGRVARVWGSLTQSRNSGANVTQMKEVSENVQINLWNYGWANIDEMYELGFDLINCNDGHYYVVPNAGYYYDYLNDNTLYNLDINTISNFTVPAGDKQMVGGAFAVWNDMTDYLENGVSEYDVYKRVENAIPLFGAKLWGKGEKSLNDANAARNELGAAPQANFNYEVKSNGNAIINFALDSLEDLSSNGYDLTQGVNASIETVDGRNALLLNGEESYINSPLTTVGVGNDLRVKVKRISDSKDEQILFESEYGTIKAVQKETGKVGFSRENHDYSFNYELPINEWVELEFKNAQDITKLYVNGQLIDILGDDEKAASNQKLLATTMFPLERIGSKTNAFVGYVDDIRLGKNEEFNSTMELDYAAIEAVAWLKENDSEELADLLDEAKSIFVKYSPSKEEIERLTERIYEILNKEDYAVADYTRVDKYLELVSKDLDLSIFTDQSVAELNRVIDSIKKNLPVYMQETVDGYAISIENALNGLVLKEKQNVNFIDNSRLTANASSYQDNGSHPNKAIDNDPSTIWHTQWSITTMPHWISFEIDQKALINGITYTPRSNAGNGTLTKYIVQVSDDGINWRDIKEGTLPRNDESKFIGFDAVETKYIRLYYVEAVGNFGSAAEIKLHDAAAVADLDGLNALIAKANAIAKDGYTDESWNDLQAYIEEARRIVETSTDADEVEEAKRMLTALILKLKVHESVQNVNKIALLDVINIAKTVTDEDLLKVIGSVAAEFKEAYEAAMEGLYDPSLSQDEVDALVERLIEILEKLGISVVDKKQLQEYVAECSNLNEDDYTAETWQAFAEAFKHAQDVLNDKNATQTDVDDAYASLQAAVKALQKKSNEEPVEPTEPVNPANPEKPVNPEEPVNPEKPVNPDKLGDESAKTGDTVNMTIYGIMIVLTSIVLSWFNIRRKKEME